MRTSDASGTMIDHGNVLHDRTDPRRCAHWCHGNLHNRAHAGTLVSPFGEHPGGAAAETRFAFERDGVPPLFFTETRTNRSRRGRLSVGADAPEAATADAWVGADPVFRGLGSNGRVC